MSKTQGRIAGRIVRLLLIAGMTALLAACTPSREWSDGGHDGGRDHLSREEIQSISASTLHEVVSRLRPQWLRTRGQRSFGLPTQVVVYQNQTFLGGPDVLHRLGVEGAWALRYVDGTTASNTLPGLGSRHVSGAIMVLTTPP